MIKQCTICTSPRRAEIESDLIAGKTYEYIAQKYNVSRRVVRRHWHNKHAAEDIAQAARAREVADGDILLEQVENLKGRALKILGQAEKEGTREACMALREVRGIVELLAKVQGSLPDQPTININLIETQFNDFRTAVVGVICPECQTKLVETLRHRLGA